MNCGGVPIEISEITHTLALTRFQTLNSITPI